MILGKAHSESYLEDQTLSYQTEDEEENRDQDDNAIIKRFLEKRHSGPQDDVKGATKQKPFTAYSNKVKKRARFLFSDEPWDDVGNEAPTKADESGNPLKDCQFQTEMELRREMKKKEEVCQQSDERACLGHLKTSSGSLWTPADKLWSLGRKNKKR